MAKQKILPFFIPHLGCKNACTFCDQHTITGAIFREDKIREDLAAYFEEKRNIGTQIAFFGGSFTAMERERMVSFLTLAYPYVDKGLATGIRISTRPDAVDDDTLSLLKAYGVTHIELGIQSMSDAVLSACRRGHTAAQSEDALCRVVSHGFITGGQMMVGLPRSTPESEMETAKTICRFGAKESRIYPTLVFPHTELFLQMQRGEYRVLALDEAVERCVPLREEFYKHGVTVLRMGLCESESLHGEEQPLGPSHPAFGELVEQACLKEKIDRFLQGKTVAGKRIEITVSPRAVSRFRGHGGIESYFINRYNPAAMCVLTDADMTDERGVKIVLKDH